MPSLAELPLTLYMGTIVYLIILLLPTGPYNRYRLLLSGLTILSLLLTWSQMFLYLYRSYTDSAIRANVTLDEWSATKWLGSTDLFEEAWGYVCTGAERWWWSSQICLGTVGVWTAFLWDQGRKHKIPYLPAYMLLGQIVAISFASGLFFLALPALTAATHKHQPANPRIPTSLLLAVLIGYISTYATPWVVGTKAFLPSLLVMHAALFVPLFFQGSSSEAKPTGMRLSHLYKLSAVLSAIHYLITTSQLPDQPLPLPQYLWRVLLHHPAQASVSLDVICFSALSFVWLLHDFRFLVKERQASSVGGKGVPGAMAMLGAVWMTVPVVGTAAGLAGWLGWRETVREETEKLRLLKEGK